MSPKAFTLDALALLVLFVAFLTMLSSGYC